MDTYSLTFALTISLKNSLYVYKVLTGTIFKRSGTLVNGGTFSEVKLRHLYIVHLNCVHRLPVKEHVLYSVAIYNNIGYIISELQKTTHKYLKSVDICLQKSQTLNIRTLQP